MYIYVCIILYFQLTLVYRNHEMFTRFVNMLMSDVTYLLDESLSKLSEIHQIQLEMEDTAAWEAQPVVRFFVDCLFVYKTMNSPSCMYV